jgi:Mor family transcriptional regulator
MKNPANQKFLDMPPPDPLDEIQGRILLEKENAAELKRLVKDQEVKLRNAALSLEELRVVLYEVQQGELFDDESTETFEQLRGIIGDGLAGEIARVFAGTMVYIPKNAISRNIHRKIKREFREGATYKELSKKYKYTERYIRNLVDKRKEAGK